MHLLSQEVGRERPVAARVVQEGLVAVRGEAGFVGGRRQRWKVVEGKDVDVRSGEDGNVSKAGQKQQK